MQRRRVGEARCGRCAEVFRAGDTRRMESCKPATRSHEAWCGSREGKPYLYEGVEDPKKGGVPALRTVIRRLGENLASVLVPGPGRSIRSGSHTKQRTVQSR